VASELLTRLADLDRRCEEIVAAARAEAEKMKTNLAPEVERLGAEADAALRSEIAARASSLAEERRGEIEACRAERDARLKALAAIPESRLDELADAVAKKIAGGAP
jgi:vacuolar-type H+-ATPase subunit E/Vma4